jgi:hypothetical protein
MFPLQVTDPTGPIPDPNNPVLSRELYEQIIHYATIPVLLFLIWFSWFLINRLMNPERRQERRNREIRKAVAEREALKAQREQDVETHKS